MIVHTETIEHNSNIVVCEVCDGKGYTTESELVCYHNGDYEYWDTTCHRCNGAVLLKRTEKTVIEYEIYTPPKMRPERYT